MSTFKDVQEGCSEMGLSLLEVDRLARDRNRWRFAVQKLGCQRAPTTVSLVYILRVSWTAKRTNDWVLDKAEVSRSFLESVKAMKLTYFGHVMRSSSESLGSR